MCYFLYIASPLTLSEIRSMLPQGLTADLAPSAERAALQKLHPPARTVARLLVGACSCDLVRARLDDPIEDERELRARYQRERLSRNEIIRRLEQHRRGSLPRQQPAGGWTASLAAFVVEHARNAGPTLYLLEFAPQGRTPGASPHERISRSVSEVRRGAGEWLTEGRAVIVS